MNGSNTEDAAQCLAFINQLDNHQRLPNPSVMADALLKVKQLRALGIRVRTCRRGTPDYVELIKQGEALEAEIDAVIDQIEAPGEEIP